MTKRRLSSAAARRGDLVADWIERFCCHVKGELAGRPLHLEQWQRRWVQEVFGPVGRDGRRRTRTALLGVARKQGKSTLAAAVALYLLFADDEPGAEVYSAAADRDQARAVFDVARHMVEASPALNRHAKVCRSWIEVPSTQSLYRVLSADARRHHGLNPHGVVIDELHAQPNRELYDVLTSGQGARRQPLTVAITTAGYDRQSICYELYEYGRRLESGVAVDPSWHFRWYGADADADWQDPKVWAQANPNLGVSVDLKFLQTEMATAAQQPARQNAARRLYLNQWTQASSRWLDLDVWDAAAGIVDERRLHGRRCHGGLDLAVSTDVAALCWHFPPDDDDGVHEAVWRFWVPEGGLDRLVQRTAGQAAVWAREGWLTVTDGAVIDYQSVLDTIDRDARQFDVVDVAYDRWGATHLVQMLQDSGMQVVQMGQGFASMSPPAKEWARLVTAGLYRHGGNPAMRWMVDNCVVRQDPAGNIKPDKSRSVEKIDGVVAAVMALDRSLRSAAKKQFRAIGF